jgi:hypothetical protein
MCGLSGGIAGEREGGGEGGRSDSTRIGKNLILCICSCGKRETQRLDMQGTYPSLPPSIPPSLSFFMGKNKVMQKALGTHPEDEFRDNLRFLSKVREGGREGGRNRYHIYDPQQFILPRPPYLPPSLPPSLPPFYSVCLAKWVCWPPTAPVKKSSPTSVTSRYVCVFPPSLPRPTSH